MIINWPGLANLKIGFAISLKLSLFYNIIQPDWMSNVLSYRLFSSFNLFVCCLLFSSVFGFSIPMEFHQVLKMNIFRFELMFELGD